MQRLLVALLAAVDAAIAAAVGLTVLLAPLTLLWTLALGAGADWGSLWPVTGLLWQFGHGVPLDIVVADEVRAAIGLPAEAATFALSVTPLALLLFTLFFSARSGVRAARSGAWLGGVITGTAAFAAVAGLVAVTSRVTGIGTSLAMGIALPTGVYLLGSLIGAVAYAWREGDEGLVDRLHDVVDSWGDFGAVPAEVARGTAIVLAALTGIGALGVALMVALRGGEVVALFESAHVDALGATVITLGQLAYLPTLIVWAVAWIAGPGFAIGSATAVSPVGTQLGVVPGIPIFGLLPENGSMWMLIVVLLPVAAGALAGWMIRSRLVWEGTASGALPRAVIAVAIALLTATAAAILGILASGGIGPGRLVEVGPDAGMLALAVGGEVLVGAAILLLSPRHRDELAEERTDQWTAHMGASPLAVDDPIAAPRATASSPGPEDETAPIEESTFFRPTAGDSGIPEHR